MKKTILIVSHSSNTNTIFKAILTEQYKICIAENTQEAIDVIMREEQVHLIIATLQFKKGDSFEFIAQIRELREPYSQVPAVFLSNYFDPQAIVQAHKYDVSDIIKLPIEPLEFCARIHEILMKYAKPYEKPDPVTGLHKKQYAEEQIKELLDNGKKGTLMLIDVDKYNFASSKVKDEVLLRCRDVLNERKRPGSVLSTVKGGGFLLFIPNLRSKTEIEGYAAELISQMLEVMDMETVYISIGLALTDRHGTNYDDLYQICDMGLGAARQNGKNKACFFKW